MSRKFFVGGNFKMNGCKASIDEIVNRLNDSDLSQKTEVVIAPPSVYLSLACEKINQNKVQVSAQNVFNVKSGAYTGELSPLMVKDVGASWTILGHSERRTINKESNELVAEKTKCALDNNLKVILCIGENIEDRNRGDTLKICIKQLTPVMKIVSQWSNVVIAYEPVWAIGTGITPTPEEAQIIHKNIRSFLSDNIGSCNSDRVRIIYGGSITEKNASDFKSCPDIDGFLVGGASLKPGFIDIINSRS